MAYAVNHKVTTDMNVGVIDIGHKTLDMVYFSEGEYVEKSKQTTEPGVSRELDEIIQMELSRPRGRRFTHSDLVKRIETDRGLVTPGHVLYVAGADDCLRAYTRTVLSAIRSCIQRKVLVKMSEFDDWMKEHRINNGALSKIVNEVMAKFAEKCKKQ
jgi:hypothetical protein